MNRIRLLFTCLLVAPMGCQSNTRCVNMTLATQLDHTVYYQTVTSVTPVIDGEVYEFDVAILALDKQTNEMRSKVAAPNLRCEKGKKEMMERGNLRIDVDWEDRESPVCIVDLTIANQCVAHSEVEVAVAKEAVSAPDAAGTH